MAGARHALRDHVRVAEQQRVGALGEGELRQHRFRPGAGQLRHLRIADEDVQRAPGQRQQIGLLSIELEGDQLGGARQGRDMAQAGATGDAASRLDEDVAQAPRAIRMARRSGRPSSSGASSPAVKLVFSMRDCAMLSP
jgi:hypothetical protein